MKLIRFTFLALATFAVGAAAQQPTTPAPAPAVAKPSKTPSQPAKSPKAAPASAKAAATSPRPAASKPVFEVARVNPGAGARTRTLSVESLGRKNTVQVGEAVLTREHLRNAATGTEKMKVTSGAKPESRDVPVIRLRFTKTGSKALSELSRAAQGGLLAVLVDGQIIAVPKVSEPVTGGEWTISGNFTAASAKALVDRINAAH